MNKWFKSAIFALGVTMLMGCFMWVLESPVTTEEVIPWGSGKMGAVSLKTSRELPPMSNVLVITFVGAYLVGITIFKPKNN